MKAAYLVLLSLSWAVLTQGNGYAAPLRPAFQRPGFVSSSGSQCGSAAPLCGKPLAVRPGVSVPLFPRRLEAAAFQAAGSRLVKIPSPRKGEAFPQSGAAEPLVRIHASDEQQNHGRASDTNHRTARASLIKAVRPTQRPNSGQRFIPRNSTNVHQPDSSKPYGSEEGGFIGSKTVNNALTARTPSVARSAAPSFTNPRHRTPNPAVVSGSATSHSSNTAALNGTRMSRKP
jgi:hypothetical protein